MGQAERRESRPRSWRSATRWTQPACASRWTSTATRRSPPTSSPGSKAFRRGATRSAPSYARFRAILERRSPDFQTAKGYGVAKPGKANLSMSTNQLAERYGACAMTLEMPFKDNDDLPDPDQGGAPNAATVARDCLASLVEWLEAERYLRVPVTAIGPKSDASAGHRVAVDVRVGRLMRPCAIVSARLKELGPRDHDVGDRHALPAAPAGAPVRPSLT
jgi:hypothetical protein